MADLILRSDLVEKLQRIAEREQRPVDEVVETLLGQYTPPETDNMPPKRNPLLIMAEMAEDGCVHTQPGNPEHRICRLSIKGR